MKHIIIIIFILIFATVQCKEYTESPFSVISDLIKMQIEKESQIQKEEMERLKEQNRIKEISEEEAKKIELESKKRILKERKIAEAEERERRKNKFILKLNLMYPNLVQLPLYSISRNANPEAGIELEYNRKISNKIDIGAGTIFGTGVTGQDKKGYYRGPQFYVIPVYVVGKYKTAKRILGYRVFYRGVAGYPIVMMKDTTTTPLNGIAYLGMDIGVDNSKYIFELGYEVAIMNVDVVNIEADSSKVMFKMGYIF